MSVVEIWGPPINTSKATLKAFHVRGGNLGAAHQHIEGHVESREVGLVPPPGIGREVQQTVQSLCGHGPLHGKGSAGTGCCWRSWCRYPCPWWKSGGRPSTHRR